MSRHTNEAIAMPVNHRLPRLSLLLTALVGALVIAAVITAIITPGGRGGLTPGGETPRPPTPGSAAGVPDQAQPLPPDVVLTTLDAAGFTPAEIAHEAGRMRVVVQNRSGVARLDLRLDGEQTSRFAERRALGEVQGWTAEVELGAGTYTITEARHPEWVCRLTVR